MVGFVFLGSFWCFVLFGLYVPGLGVVSNVIVTFVGVGIGVNCVVLNVFCGFWWFGVLCLCDFV